MSGTWILIGLGSAAAAVIAHAAPAPSPPPPVISNVRLASERVARFDRYEVRFEVATGDANPSLPFDASPPPGVPPAIGVSVDALFTPDDWTTVIVQPAFLDQPLVRSVRDGQDHLTPDGPPHWTARFAPQMAGRWQMRLRARDAGGTTMYPLTGAIPFTVGERSDNPYRRRGFLRVSQADPRYFEFQDGTPFIGVGYNTSYGAIEQAEERMRLHERHRINFVRAWMSGHGINGSQWTSWAYPDQPSDYVPIPSLETGETFQGADVALRLDQNVRCLWTDFWQGRVSVQPGATYQVSARIRLDHVSGPGGGGPWGFVMKLGAWLGEACDHPDEGVPISAPVTGSTGWITVTGRFTARPDQYFMDNLYLARQNATGGQVFIDQVRAWRADDPDRTNILREPNANSHLHFDPLNAAVWDAYIDSAERHGVYLKLVIDEKNEWIRNHIGADGRMTNQASNDNFYAAPDTKVRWLHEAWWRYLIARWGYSTAIHSFEFVNEGDPYNGHHYDAANAMALYFDRHDPSRHMVTTSTWHSFPNYELWSNPRYAALDYADLHAYISTGWGPDASFIRPDMIETRPEHVREGAGSIRLARLVDDRIPLVPRGIVIQEPGEWILRYWMKAESYAANCGFGSTGGMQRVRWLIVNGDVPGVPDNIVPANDEHKDFLCASPAGTYGWTQFRSDRDRDGRMLPLEQRLVLHDARPREVSIWIENSERTSGEAWIDQIELVSPSGRVVPVIGRFDPTPFVDDVAWYTRAYGELYGGRSPVGGLKPLVRGEAGIDTLERIDSRLDLNDDTRGIWLHQLVWGQINPGGMYDLMWGASTTIDRNPDAGRYTHIYTSFLTYQNFMTGIPLNNGHYVDARASTSNPGLRAWGQRDDANGRMHLWIQNVQLTWRRAASGPPVQALDGQVVLPDVPPGRYRVAWWDTHAVDRPVFREEIVAANGSLTLALPHPLADDVAVKVERLR
jgi:hypothetical protein